jgi:hypothetical protein
MLSNLSHPTTPREVVRNVTIGAVSLVAGTWLVALLTQLKFFDNPKHQLIEVAHFFAWLMAQGWFLLLSGLVVGFGAGVWLDAYLVRRTGKIWWQQVQAFTIRDAACFLAGVKRAEFERSDRAVAIANEMRGYINSGHVPLFLEIEFDKPLPDLADPKARYEPPYDKKSVGYDAVIPKRFIENLARARQWPIPWPLPPVEEGDTFPRPLKRPQPPPPPPRTPGEPIGLGKLLELYSELGKKIDE